MPENERPVDNVEDKVNQTDMALVELMAVLIGGAVIMSPGRQEGLDEVLRYLARTFAGRDDKKAAALVEMVRLKATDYRSDPALLHKLRQRPPGSGQPN